MSETATAPEETGFPPVNLVDPQLTIRAVLTGMVLGGILSLCNIYSGLKIGWGFNMSITAMLLGFGASDVRDNYREPDLRAPYAAMTACFGFLLDGGGRDRYRVRDRDTDDVSEHPVATDDARWLQPEPGSDAWGFENFGVGVDCENGIVPEWERFLRSPDADER